MAFGQKAILVKINNQKNHVFFMPYAFSQNEHPFVQCKQFDKIKHYKNS
jgi:hypothetical protein